MQRSLAIILTLLNLSSTAQISELPYTYNIQNGLSNNRVYNIIEDDRGLIWIGTHNGLNRFDGRSFAIYNTGNSKLLSNTIWRINKGRPHELIVGTNYGVVMLNTRTGIMRNLLVKTIPELMPYANNVRHLAYTSANELILGTQNGIYVLDTLGKIITELEAGYSTNDIGIIRLHFSFGVKAFTNGDALILTKNGYHYYDCNKKKILPIEKLPASLQGLKYFLKNHADSYVFEINQSDHLFFIDHFGSIDSLFILDIRNNKSISYPLPFAARHNIRWDSKIQFHPDNLVSITTAKGGFSLFRYDNKLMKLELVSSDNAISLFCQYVLFDSRNFLWLGSETGVHYGGKQQTNIVNVPTVSAVKNHGYFPILSILKHSKQTWLGTYSGQIGIIVLDSNEQYKETVDIIKNKADRNFISLISEWNKDSLLIGTKHGAYKLNIQNKGYKPFSISYSNDTVSRLILSSSHKSRTGERWLSGGQTGGVWRVTVSGDSIIHYMPGKTRSDYPMRNAGAFAEDSAGNIWMVHWVDGLTRWNTHKKYFDTLIRRWPDKKLSGFDCSGIAIDKKNNFWFFINTYGLASFDMRSNTLHRVAAIPDLAEDNASCLKLTGDSLLWMNLKHSLLVYNLHSKQLYQINQKHGLPDEPHSSMELFYDSSEKVVYAGFSKHISKIPVAFTGDMKPRHETFISGIKVLDSEEMVDISKPVILSPGKNDIQINFLSPDFTHFLPDPVFEYRILPDQKWTTIGITPYLNLHNLRNGDYTVQIRNAGIGGLEESISSIDFTILPFYYQTNWFRLIIFLSLVILTYIIYRFRIKQIVKEHEMRKAIASDLHDDIGSRLTNIQILSIISEDSGTPESERSRYLKKISEEALASGDALDEIVHNMHEKTNDVNDMIARIRRHTEDVFEHGHPEYKMVSDTNNVCSELDPAQGRDLFLAYKEVLNNISKHAKATHVSIHVYLKHQVLKIEVNDDGIGFNPGLNHNRNGMLNINERIRRWKGSVDINTKSGAGTTVRISMPIKKTSHIKGIFHRYKTT